MAKVALVAPELDDLHHIADQLRQADIDELLAVHGPDLDLRACLVAAVAASEECWVAVTAYGEPIAVFGVAPLSLLGGQGIPWMLGTDALERHARDIVQLSRAHVQRWGLRYDQLFNYVDARNVRSIEWLKRTGFYVFNAEPYGVAGLPFHRFERCT